MEIIDKIKNSKSFEKISAFVKNDRLSHAYFITGENDFSLKEFCKVFALKLVCESGGICEKCDSCKKFLSGFHPDVLFYPLGKSFLVADSESILENVQIKPLEANYKIIVINRIDNSTVQAQNKILKTLEDSPKNVIFLLTAINHNAVLPTIKSRAQALEIENFEVESEVQTEERKFLQEMLTNMTTSKQIINYVQKFSEKTNFKNRLQYLGELFDKILQTKSSGEIGELTTLAEQFEVGAIGEIFAVITDAKRKFNANVNTNLITDMLLFKILEVKYLWNKNK